MSDGTNFTVNRDDFVRLVGKVENIEAELKTIILLQERQINQGERIGTLEQRVAADEAITAKIDRQLTSWINRGIGVWSLAVALFALFNAPVIVRALSGK